MRTLEKVSVLSYSEFDDLVNKHFPEAKFEFVAWQEANNYTDFLYEDVRKEFKYDFELNEYQELMKGNYKYKGAHNFLEALVVNDVLEEGHYIIEVSW